MWVSLGRYGKGWQTDRAGMGDIINYITSRTGDTTAA